MRLLKHLTTEPRALVEDSNEPRRPPSRGPEQRIVVPNLGDTSLFRAEAVKEHAQVRTEGDLVRIAPRWANSVYWVLMAAFSTGLLFAVFGKVREYATGPAVVRLTGHTEVTATLAGVVDAVDVQTGDRVRSGQVLARFNSREEQSLVDKLQLEFDQELVALLRTPNDPVARATVGRAHADLELARARLEQRLMRAPLDATVFDIRVRAGQLVNSGDPVVSLVRSDRRYEIVAFIPGRYGPLLRAGQGLHLRLSGYADTRIDVSILDLSDAVIGPSEARRFLGPEIADAFFVQQPVIWVRAALQEPSFESNGRRHSFYSGLQGTAEVRVGDERILFCLLPWLRPLKDRWK